MNRIAAAQGLRHRLQRIARRIGQQHCSINDYYQTLANDLDQRPKDRIRSDFDGYRKALSAHFDLEEQVFFPALRGADASQSPKVRQLVANHSRMLAELAHLARSIESLPAKEFSRRLTAFASILASHEQQEESLLERVLEPPPAAHAAAISHREESMHSEC